MNKKIIKEIKNMCRVFCIANKIKWTRKFERRYIKEFFLTKRMDIKPLVKTNVVYCNIQPVEGDTD